MRKQMMAVVGLAATLTLAACGAPKSVSSHHETTKSTSVVKHKKKANSSATETSSSAASETHMVVYNKTPKSFYSFAEDAMTNSRVYYLLNTDGNTTSEATAIRAIVYFDHGKATFYNCQYQSPKSENVEANLLVKDIAGLSDAQAIEKAKQFGEKPNQALAPKVDLSQSNGFIGETWDSFLKSINSINPQTATSTEIALKDKFAKSGIKNYQDMFQNVMPKAQPLQISAVEGGNNTVSAENLVVPPAAVTHAVLTAKGNDFNNAVIATEGATQVPAFTTKGRPLAFATLTAYVQNYEMNGQLYTQIGDLLTLDKDGKATMLDKTMSKYTNAKYDALTYDVF